MQHDKPIHVFINKRKYELDCPLQTGASLKRLGNIPLQDVLFLQARGDDEVIANDAKVTLKKGDHLHSQPPADYGFGEIDLREAGIGLLARDDPPAGGWLVLPRDLRLQAPRWLPARGRGLARQVAAGLPGRSARHVLGPPSRQDDVREASPGDLHREAAGERVAALLLASGRRRVAAGIEHAARLHALHRRAVPASGLRPP